MELLSDISRAASERAYDPSALRDEPPLEPPKAPSSCALSRLAETAALVRPNSCAEQRVGQMDRLVDGRNEGSLEDPSEDDGGSMLTSILRL